MRLGSGYYRIEETIITPRFCNTLHKRVLYSIFCTIVCFEYNMFKKFNIQNMCHSTNS
ncbi:hypothetical protein C0J52_28200 [Blattella germanica]|nr:hypothetical protein C0J52_28200 [Blattella germanica]